MTEQQEKIELLTPAQLSDELCSIDNLLVKASFLVGELNDKYFTKHSGDKDEDQFAIWYDFSKYGIMAGMLDDYIYQTKQILREILNRIDEIYENSKLQGSTTSR